MAARAASALASRRFYELIEEIKTTERERRGWQARAARVLEIHPSYVVKVLRGKGAQPVGVATIDNAVSRLGIDPLYFSLAEAEADGLARDWLGVPTRIIDAGGTLLEELEYRAKNKPNLVRSSLVTIARDDAHVPPLDGRRNTVLRLPPAMLARPEKSVEVQPVLREDKLSVQLDVQEEILTNGEVLSDEGLSLVIRILDRILALGPPDAVEAAIATRGLLRQSLRERQRAAQRVQAAEKALEERKTDSTS